MEKPPAACPPHMDMQQATPGQRAATVPALGSEDKGPQSVRQSL